MKLPRSTAFEPASTVRSPRLAGRARDRRRLTTRRRPAIRRGVVGLTVGDSDRGAAGDLGRSAPRTATRSARVSGTPGSGVRGGARWATTPVTCRASGGSVPDRRRHRRDEPDDEDHGGQREQDEHQAKPGLLVLGAPWSASVGGERDPRGRRGGQRDRRDVDVRVVLIGLGLIRVDGGDVDERLRELRGALVDRGLVADRSVLTDGGRGPGQGPRGVVVALEGELGIVGRGAIHVGDTGRQDVGEDRVRDRIARSVYASV